MALLTSIPFTGTSEDNLKSPEKMRAPCPMIPNEKKRGERGHGNPLTCYPQAPFVLFLPTQQPSCYIYQMPRLSPSDWMLIIRYQQPWGRWANWGPRPCLPRVDGVCGGGCISQLTSCCHLMFHLHADHLLRGPGLPGPPLRVQQRPLQPAALLQPL